jgi:hypothetical protein
MRIGTSAAGSLVKLRSAVPLRIAEAAQSTMPEKIAAKRRKLEEAAGLIDDAEVHCAQLAEELAALEQGQHNYVAVIQAVARRRVAVRALHCAQAAARMLQAAARRRMLKCLGRRQRALLRSIASAMHARHIGVRWRGISFDLVVWHVAATTLQRTVRGQLGRRRAARAMQHRSLARVRIRLWRARAPAPYAYSPLVQPRWRAHHPSQPSPANDEPARSWRQEVAGLPMWAPDRKRAAVTPTATAAASAAAGSRSASSYASLGCLLSPSASGGANRSRGRVLDRAGPPTIAGLPLTSSPVRGSRCGGRPQSAPMSTARPVLR